VTPDVAEFIAEHMDTILEALAAGAVTSETEVFALARDVLDEPPADGVRHNGVRHNGVRHNAKSEPPTLQLRRAAHLGLVAKWSREFGFITMHDPATGEMYDVPTSEAPDWAKAEAGERKCLWRQGDKRAYTYTARELEERYQRPRPDEPEDEGIVEDHPIPD
jgi:hypothetical protein